MSRLLLLVLLASTALLGQVRSYTMALRCHAALPGIKILDEKHLDFDTIDGVSFHEISDLTYRPEHNTLYLLSDKGALFTFRARFDRQAILSPLHGYRLTDSMGKRLKKRQRDSEGLTHDVNGTLYVSFEQVPRVAVVSTAGQVTQSLPLPKTLRSLRQYRKPNQQLESIAWHPKYGWMVAKEYPLRGTKKTHQALYSLSGRIWHFQTEKLPHNAITAIEVMDDGNILVLERSFDKKNLRIIITLKKVYLDTIRGGQCRTEVLASLRTDDGWILDNFEGLARVAPHRYVMVSDDGHKFYEKTLLIYFEVTR